MNIIENKIVGKQHLGGKLKWTYYIKFSDKAGLHGIFET